MQQFRNIGIIGRLGSSQVLDTIRRLKRFLADRGLHVILEEAIADVLPGHGMQVSSRKSLGEACDLVIVVGGDGSLLGAARVMANHKVPVLGINRGSLGFLTDIRPDELEKKVGEVLDGEYMMESRFLLEAEVRRGGEAIGQGDALNDVVLHPGKSTRMIEFELHIDGQFVCSQKADGLIISTPTGSTAYALSAGGPIMHPKLDAMVIVPMYPHTLSSRPIVVDGNSELKIVVSPNMQIYPQVSCDGQNHFTCAPGDTVKINKKPRKLRLIHPLDHNYYEVCRTKLGWGSRLGTPGGHS
jgi:NAD+ kinase